MKKKNNLITVVMAMILSLTVFMTSMVHTEPVPIYASGLTKEEAIDYVLKYYNGKYIDTDGTGYDCVDLAKKYFKDIGGMPYTRQGDAKNYAKASTILPKGWKFVYTNTPEIGDLPVWIYGKTGHIAIIIAINGDIITVLEQNTNTQTAATTKDYSLSKNPPAVYIRPNFLYKAKFGNGNYAIQPACNHNYALDITDVSLSNGAKTQLWTDFDSKNQKFYLCNTNGMALLYPLHSMKNLAVNSVGNIIQMPFAASVFSNKFTIWTEDGSSFYIKASNGQYLTYSSLRDGASIYTTTFTGNANQQWHIRATR